MKFNFEDRVEDFHGDFNRFWRMKGFKKTLFQKESFWVWIAFF